MSLSFDYYILNVYEPELDGPGPELYARWAEQICLADRLGYDTAWMTEHHFRHFGGMMPSPQLFLASLAPRTSRIRLGTAVSILPLHHPVRIAEDLAMLDVVSGGRLEVGVGRGMPKLEYEVFGADWPTAQESLIEEIAILRGAWTERPFSWAGERYAYPTPMEVLPPPIQRPHPPIWVTANFDPEHFRWIGSQGFNLMTIPWLLPSLDRSRELIGVYTAALAEAGYDPASRQVLSMFLTHVAASDDEAARAGEYWQRFSRAAFGERGGDFAHSLTWDQMVAQHRVIAGAAATCREHVRFLADLGLTHIATNHHFGGLPQALALESIQRFADEVATGFRQLAERSPY